MALKLLVGQSAGRSVPAEAEAELMRMPSLSTRATLLMFAAILAAPLLAFLLLPDGGATEAAAIEQEQPAPLTPH
ncbi:MAG: hypothetical protein SGJ21_05655 [Alphaproteobacteria bacterium]|nr:hypothetical protein [Alphaproteobacteria bacterium]